MNLVGFQLCFYKGGGDSFCEFPFCIPAQYVPSEEGKGENYFLRK